MNLIKKFTSSTLAIRLYRLMPLPQKLKDWIVTRLTPSFSVAVLGVIFNEKNEILLFHHTYRKYPWGMPGGWLEEEQPDLAIEREVFEESGFRVKAEKVLHVSYESNPRRILIFMKCQFQGGAFIKSEEVSDYRFCPIDNLPTEMSLDQKKRIEMMFAIGV